MNVASNLALALACTAALVATAIASPPLHHRDGQSATQQALAAVPPEARNVSSLSVDEVDGLLSGRGLGLASAAELNGYPAPHDVLALSDELGLDADQHRAVQRSYDRMKSKAVEVAARYVAAERALDDAFRMQASPSMLTERVAAAERRRAELRLIHLAAHLEISPLLTPDQRQRFAGLRHAAIGAQSPSLRSHSH